MPKPPSSPTAAMLSIFSDLRERRVFQILAAYAAGGWLLLQGIDQLIGRNLLPEVVYPLTLVFFVVGFPATALVGWIHGERGEQRIRPLEVWALAALGVVAFVVSGLVLQRHLDGGESVLRGSNRAMAAGPAYDPNRLAVLYFDVITPDTTLVPLAAGLTESLIHELGQVQALDVISRNGVGQFRDTDVPFDSIARSLSVGTLVQGSLARSGDRLRVNVSLVDAGDGSTLETRTLESPRGDLFALQDSLAREVSSWLRERLGDEVQLREVRAGTQSLAAWELVQRAGEVVKQVEPIVMGGDVRAGEREYARADALLAEAEALDPAWPRPPALRALLAYQRSRWAGTGDRDRTAGLVREGLEHASRALYLDSADAAALEVRGTLRYWGYLLNLDPGEGEGRLREAEVDLRRAVDSDPRQAGAWSVLSHLLLSKGASTAEAKMAAQRAYEADAYLDNAEVILWRLYIASYDLQDAVEAEHWCEEGRRRFPEDQRFVECHLWNLTLPDVEPRPDSAWGLLTDYLRLVPPQQEAFRRAWGRMAVAAVLARAELPDSARRVAEGARADPSVDPTRDVAYLEAYVRTLVGDREEAIRLLTTYLATNPQQRLDAAENWWFVDLRSLPAFETLVSD